MNLFERICEFIGSSRRTHIARTGRNHFVFVLPAGTSEEQRNRFVANLKSLRPNEDVVIYGGAQVFEL